MSHQPLSRGVLRKVDRHHLAFYRGYLQELDIEDMARRYLGEDVGLHEAKETLAWVKGELTRTARLHKRFDYARLLSITIPKRKNARTERLPSLEEFREERDPHEFYGENELLEMYQEAYPEAFSVSLKDIEKQEQKNRLMRAQLDAITWAENNLIDTPTPKDSVGEWFNTDKAAAFIMKDVRTLGDLVRLIHQKGYRWWVGIRGIGQTQGQRIVKWLASHETSLGMIESQALVPLRKLDIATLSAEKETGIRPLESFLLPEAFNGTNGDNRFPGRCRIEATNDYAAIQAWLKARATNSNTERSYRREAERLLLWAVLEKTVPLSSLSVDDMTDYRDWLAALGQTPPDQWRWEILQERWIGKRHIQRWSKDWKPFDGPLSHRSQAQAFTVMKSMFEWMTKVRYLDSNPLEAVTKPKLKLGDPDVPDVELTRALSRLQIKYAFDYLHQLPIDARVARLRFVITFGYTTGLRLSELTNAKTNDLYSAPLKTRLGVRWMIKVLGKGGKVRPVPMPTKVMQAMREYFEFREADLQGEEFLIGRIHGKTTAPLDPTIIYKMIKDFFKEVAWDMRDHGHIEDAAKLEKATTHWLRHSRGSHSAETMPPHMLQRLLGHASLDTTSIYTSADADELYENMEKELGSVGRV
jgi:site-specific recombinase XerD